MVVSEETGMISIAENGVLSRGLTEENLNKRLEEAFSVKPTKKKSFSDFLNWGEQV